MKTILVPTDFSEHAFFALKVAAAVARKINAGIELVHVHYLPRSGFELYEYYDEFYKEINTKATKQLDKLLAQDFLKSITVNKHIITNMAMWKIFNNEKFNNVDLVVIGAYGSSGVNNMFLGSNTEKVVRYAGSPVLTIKNDIKDFSIKKMVFASNFNNEAYTVFNKIKFFADIYQAHIDLLKVITPRDFEPTPLSLQSMERFASKFKLSNYSINIYNDLSIEKGITEFSNQINADLLALETHGRTGFAHFFNGSLAEDIAMHENRPVLSIKIKDIPVNISGLKLDSLKNTGIEFGLAPMIY